MLLAGESQWIILVICQLHLSKMPRHMTEDDWQEFAASLPEYSSVAAAVADGLSSGAYFILTGIVLGLNTVKLIAKIP